MEDSSTEGVDPYVQDISGDGSEDEFERKFKDAYEEHKNKGVVRPSSSSGNVRPQTASRLRPESSHTNSSGGLDTDAKGYEKTNPTIEEEEGHDNEGRSKKETSRSSHLSVYDRFSQHVFDHQIEQDMFCNASLLYVKPDEFKRYCDGIEFAITKSEVDEIFKDNNADKTEYLDINDYFKQLSCWKTKPSENVGSGLTKKKRKLKKKAASSAVSKNRKAKLGPLADRFGGDLRPHSANYSSTGNLRDLKNRPTTGKASLRSNASATSFVPNRSKYYLRKAKEREEAEELELTLAVDKGKREFEFDCLHKMGEANGISASIGSAYTFRAFKSEEGTLKCHIYEEEQFRKEISLEDFLREWRRLKRQEKAPNNAFNVTARSDMFKSNTSALVPFDPQTPNKMINKKARQDELKQVLVETMRLTNKLKEQLKTLQKKGVCPKNLKVGSQHTTAIS